MNEDAGSGIGPVGMAVSAVAGAGVGYAGLKAYDHYQGFQKEMGGRGTMGQYYDYVKDSLSNYSPSAKTAASAGVGAATTKGKAATEAIQGVLNASGKNLEGETGEALVRNILERMVRR